MILLLTACYGQSDTTRAIVKSERAQGDRSTAPMDTLGSYLGISEVPRLITRTMLEDQHGDLYFSTFGGVIRYDGQAFSRILGGVDDVPYFSCYEDRSGTLWFGSVGAGVVRYRDGALDTLTTEDGLLNDEVTTIYQDRGGAMWFGVNGGVSRYDGQGFKNFIIDESGLQEDATGAIRMPSVRPPKEVNAILQDGDDRLWFATRGQTFVYDGHTSRVVDHEGGSFSNVRSLTRDHSGAIWLAGQDGLWRYDGTRYRQFGDRFTGMVYEDRSGRIWTTAEGESGWVLSRYDRVDVGAEDYEKIEVKSGEEMLFGITEDATGAMWIGHLNGVYRYDGDVFEDFK